MTKLVIVNGPPSSGKSTGIFHLMDKIDSYPVVASAYVRAAVGALYGIPADIWEYLYENHKDTPTRWLFGQSPREAVIDLSEKYMKPRFGERVFGEISARNAEERATEGHYTDFHLVMDVGFSEEAIPLVEMVGAENAFLFRIERDGCTFANDSRSYLYAKDIGIESDNSFTLVNDSLSSSQWGSTFTDTVIDSINTGE